MSKKRKAISKKSRFEIFKRDQFTCQYCGSTPPGVVLELDHVIPVAEGGTDDPHNLVTACFDCNRGKCATPLSSVPESVLETFERQKERTEQLREYNEFLIMRREESLRTVQRIGRYWFNKYMPQQDRYCFGDSRASSVRRFLEFLPEAEILDAVDIAFGRFGGRARLDYEPDQLWKYFCGVCWGKARNRKGDGK